MLKRKLISGGIAVVLSLAVFVPTAFAYGISYYLGSPSTPVSFTGGVYGQTCCRHNRIFNEATAQQSANTMYFADLYYDSTKIGHGVNTYWYRVTRSASNVKASCSLASGGQFRVVRAYCDTTTP